MNRCLPILLLILIAAGCGLKLPPVNKPSASTYALPQTAQEPPDQVPVVNPLEKKAERKDLVTLTPAAAKELRRLMEEEKKECYLRVSVGEAGDYKLDLDLTIVPERDYLGRSRGVSIVVDRKSAKFLPAGIAIDFVNENGKKGFSFDASEPVQDRPVPAESLAEARRGFQTKLAREQKANEPCPEPPAELFRLVKYPAAPGLLAAYVTPDPEDGQKHPAIIWITGGDCNTIGEVWGKRPAANDQTAGAYRKAGIVMMFPSLRGGNENPGIKEGFFGELDDVLAAAEYLGKQSYVDPDRIYLGGHSTGGTLALLTAEYSDRFRAVFSFGPAHDVGGYGPIYCPFVLSDPKELDLRAPGRWLHSIRKPTFIFEGSGGNLKSLQVMARHSKNPLVQFFEIKRAGHFDVLAPINKMVAEKILKDTEAKCNLAFTEEELNKPFAK